MCNYQTSLIESITLEDHKASNHENITLFTIGNSWL